MDIYANYEPIALSGTQTHGTGRESGTGIMSACSPHQIFCLTTGSITIVPLKGDSFTWSSATAGQSINVVVKSTTVNSGAFVAFRSKFINPQFFGTGRST